MNRVVLEARDVHKSFELQGSRVTALRGVGFQVHQGEFVAVMGPSGGGKSTLLSLLGGLDVPSSGRVLVEGQDISQCSAAQQVNLRRGTLGYVFQGYALLSFLTVLDNVACPLMLAGVPEAERQGRARMALQEVGLLDKQDFLPEELSGGQQQRIGIARCLVTRPVVVLADEPTGNLDTETTRGVLGLLQDRCKRDRTALVVVTHDPQVARAADRVLNLQDGLLEERP